MTIAIIDAYDDPNAASDLTAFDTYYGLNNNFTFQKLNQTGGTSAYPATDPGGPNNSSGTWEEEESLDIEWAHTMAPKATILLYEATNSGTLYTALQTANANPAVNVISMSFGGGQSNGESSQNATYFSASGKTYVASTGDSGGSTGSPASLANVVAVGGTGLTAPGGSYSRETGWSGSSGGIDTYDAQPAYQKYTVSAKSTTLRTAPDVSMDANPGTGVPIYDTWDFGTTTPWVPGVEGGTSLSAPMFSGLVADADQGRTLIGLPNLSGGTATATTGAYALLRLYQLPASNFHDVTTGSNASYSPNAGYDLVTGIGTPIANVLVPNLAGAATITGRAFSDDANNGVYGGTDTPLSSQTVYLDLNNDGSLDNNEPSTTTNAQGIYTFSDQPAGGSVRMSSAAPSGYTLNVSSGSIVYGAIDTINFLYKSAAAKVAFSQAPASSTAGSTMSPVVVNIQSSSGTTVAVNTAVTLTLNGGTFNTGSNTVTVNAVNGLATFNSLIINSVGSYTITATDGSLTSVTSSTFTISAGTPTITWPSPASIVYGTQLSSTQLDATANVPGTFVYNPAAGTLLNAGSNQALSVTFTPTDTTDYLVTNGSTTITVTQATPVITWAAPSPISYGTPLSSTQLDAAASVPGSFVYSPGAGTVLNVGANQPLNVTFTPTDYTDYTTVNGSTFITVTGPLSLTGSTFYIKRDANTFANLDIWTNSTAAGLPAQVIRYNTITSITLTATSAGDSFTIDFSNGNVVPSGGLSVNGAGTASGNSLIVVGTSLSDSVTASAGTFNLNGTVIPSTDVANLYFRSPGAGESLTVPSGTVTIAPNTNLGVGTELFSSILIDAGATLVVPPASTPLQRQLIQIGRLYLAGSASAWTGTLDLSNNDLDVANGDIENLTSQVAQGTLTGSGGILSSTAQGQRDLTTLGTIQNSVDGTTTGSPLYGSGASLGTFDGASPADTDVLIKYTYTGDANLDGQIDGSDYAELDNGFNSQSTGWFNGDFNYDGVVDGSDYTLIDNAFNIQGAKLSAMVGASPTTAIAKSTVVPAAISSSFSTTQIDANEVERRKLHHSFFEYDSQASFSG